MGAVGLGELVADEVGRRARAVARRRQARRHLEARIAAFAGTPVTATADASG
jgi:hypothetical protein